MRVLPDLGVLEHLPLPINLKLTGVILFFYSPVTRKYISLQYTCYDKKTLSISQHSSTYVHVTVKQGTVVCDFTAVLQEDALLSLCQAPQSPACHQLFYEEHWLSLLSHLSCFLTLFVQCCRLCQKRGNVCLQSLAFVLKFMYCFIFCLSFLSLFLPFLLFLLLGQVLRILSL